MLEEDTASARAYASWEEKQGTVNWCEEGGTAMSWYSREKSDGGKWPSQARVQADIREGAIGEGGTGMDCRISVKGAYLLLTLSEIPIGPTKDGKAKVWVYPNWLDDEG